MDVSPFLRKTTLLARDGLPPRKRRAMSYEIAQKILLLLEELITGRTIFIYVDFRSEVETRFLISELLRRGKRVVVPVTLVKEKKLLPVQVRDLEKDLVPGYCTIPEPRVEIRQSRMIAASEIETIIVPGSVFDERGGRLGYGGGYYDRFMAYEAPEARRIGLAFDLQVVGRLPLQPHDQVLDLVVTEQRSIQGSR
ncbi:MAG: 5-formyltetrahydrofolate cyclo-ligase [Desulfoarculaceae bacterium]|nr:5-formyltetrahydrofolate cyclo-ligase [Desulfoarculaceae bacterium]